MNAVQIREVTRLKSVIKFLKTVLLVIELTIYIAYYHIDKLIFVGIIALDQYVKSQVVSTMIHHESLPIVPDFFHITYVLNPGAAFGILPYERPFLIGIGGFMLIVGALYYSRVRKKVPTAAKFGAISAAAGAAANMIDRINTGYVVDMFDFRIFPVFNIADIAIVIGLTAIMYVIFFQDEKVSTNELSS